MSHRVDAVFCTVSTLGVAGIGGPAARFARRLLEPPRSAVVLCGGHAGGAPPPGVRVLERPTWRRRLESGRLRRWFRPSQESIRVGFDERAAAALPACRVAVVENSTGLATLRRARDGFGASTVLIEHNHPFGAFREALLEERRRWGGPEPFITETLAARGAAEAAEADLVVCLSESTAAAFSAQGVAPDRLRRARLGVDPHRFRPPARPPVGFVVAFVGWLSLRKGYPYLVQGFREARMADASLLLHGGTDDPFDHALVARLRGDADVAVVRGPVEETYARASVCVLPSVSDGFGLSALEAMACGIPVIVTDACGVAECVTDGVEGFVVPARDPAAIADRLVRLRADAALRIRMGGAARERALTRPWSTYEADLLAIVDEKGGP